MVSIYTLSCVSGGTIGPAASPALGLSEKMPRRSVAIHCGVQTVAGLCAGLTFAAMRYQVVDVAPKFYGLAIGFVVIAGGYCAGPLLGGAFKPAVALGLDLSSAG